MATWEPEGIDIVDRDDIEDDSWDENAMNDLQKRYEELRQFNIKYNKSRDKVTREETSIYIDSTRNDIEELVANQIYDKLTIWFNNNRKRLGIQKDEPIVDPIRKYDNFKLADDGSPMFVYKRTVIDLGNINERIKAPSELRRLSVAKLKAMGFTNITDEDTQPYRTKYKVARDKVKKLNENLDEKSKAIESSSTTDAEAIEMIEVTSKDIDTTVKDVEQDTSFIEPSERDKLLPLRELEGLDKQLRTISGSLKVAIAKRIDLEGRIKHEERKLNEIQDPKYSDDQRDMIEGRIKRLRGELTERNKEIDILKGEASKQINQIRGSITKFLDKETGTLGERIRTLFKEQGITIVSILTALGMTIGVLIEALLGGPSASTPTPQSTTTSDKKGGAREWIKNKLKALSSLLGKLATKLGAALPGVIGSIVAWLLNRAKEVVGWLVISELVGTYHRRWSLDIHIFHDQDEERIGYLNIHHTVKTAVVPNIKAAFSSS